MATEVDNEWANEEARDQDKLWPLLKGQRGRNIYDKAFTRIAALEAQLAEAQGTIARLSAALLYRRGIGGDQHHACSIECGKNRKCPYAEESDALIAARLAPPQDAPQEKP